MYAIYGNIYHQYIPNVSIYIYIPYMDPMGWNYVHQLRQLEREPHSLIPVVFHVDSGDEHLPSCGDAGWTQFCPELDESWAMGTI